ncbi:MAG: DUF6624 domain-containing protein [Pseudomonadota bacterium]
MTYRKCSAFLAVVVAGLSCSADQAGEAQPVEDCPGAISWQRDHQSGDKAGHSEGDRNPVISEGALLEDLRLRVEKDQAARKRWLADQSSAELADEVESIDAENVAWIRTVISEKGFPTAAQVGNQGVHFAWLLLQHADQDPKLQSELLPVLEQRFSAWELPANDLARLTDRVLMASGKPQRYGTQFDWFAGDFTLPEPNELAEIDAARARLGLMPLVDYVCTLRKARSSAVPGAVSVR